MLTTPATEALIVAVAFAVAVPAFLFRGASPAPGTKRSLDLTFIPADADRLRCSSDGDYQGFRCSFDTQRRKREGLQADLELFPAVSTQRELVLLSNPFVLPALRESFARGRRSRGGGARFGVRCEVENLGLGKDVQVAFDGRSFSPTNEVWAVKALACSLQEPHD